jgi:hypothetical protein
MNTKSLFLAACCAFPLTAMSAMWTPGCAKKLSELDPFPCGTDGSCPGGYRCLAQGCVEQVSCPGAGDIATDPKNCGACGNVCATGPNMTAVCGNGVCAPICSGGFGNCDGNAANGCETRVTTDDANNCGQCGRTCQGNACNAGICSPITIATSQKPYGIAVDAANVYWTDQGTGATNNGAIMKAAHTGGTPSALASALFYPMLMALDDGSAYVSVIDKDVGKTLIIKVPLGGGGAGSTVRCERLCRKHRCRCGVCLLGGQQRNRQGFHRRRPRSVGGLGRRIV